MDQLITLLIAVLAHANEISALIEQARASGREPTPEELASLKDAAFARMRASQDALDAAIADASATAGEDKG
jgi:uncharacterized protein YdcH (DUF465 family)